MPHQLQNTWVLWELKNSNDRKDYSNLLREICEFNTVEDFWKYWMFVPKPSEVFGDGLNSIYVEGRVIKAFGLFKKGIHPSWEDPANKLGSELTAVKTFTPDVLDFFWENLVLGLIGETIDESDEICGCRVVNQTRKVKPTFKIELWLRSTDDAVSDRIRQKLSDVLVDNLQNSKLRVKAPEFEFITRQPSGKGR